MEQSFLGGYKFHEKKDKTMVGGIPVEHAGGDGRLNGLVVPAGLYRAPGTLTMVGGSGYAVKEMNGGTIGSTEFDALYGMVATASGGRQKTKKIRVKVG